MSPKIALFGAILVGALVAMASPNLARLPGATLSADNHQGAHRPQRANDGVLDQFNSRWVSKFTQREHWLQLAFPSPVAVNRLTIHFAGPAFYATDFDIQVKNGDQWRTLRAVRDNRRIVRHVSFATTTATVFRVLFHRAVPDTMVRLYELEAWCDPQPVEATLSDAICDGLLLPERPLTLKLTHFDAAPISLAVSATLKDEHGHVLQTLTKTLDLKREATLYLPRPEQYGRYLYECSLWSEPMHFVYFPPSTSRYQTSSPFGAHCHVRSRAHIRHAGIYWWRNHDLYGRWNSLADEQGRPDWRDYHKTLKFVADYGVRECSVLLGAPRIHSTILPGEFSLNPHDTVNSLYLPASSQPWLEEYVRPLIAAVRQASPYRAHEIWNEPWSYYRLRGLYGTPGEALLLFKETYLAARKADPEAIVYISDVKPECINNPYSFRNFGRDMLELGYLRWTDIVAFHSYGMMTWKRFERLRRNVWQFGRDFDFWSTETACEGKPPLHLLESLVRHRAYGNGKTFIYTADKWAPLEVAGNPTEHLVIQAALCRNLGDALPLGFHEQDGVHLYVFAHGDRIVAVAVNRSSQTLNLKRFLGEKIRVEDIYGRPQGCALLPETACFILDIPESKARQFLLKRFEFHEATAGGDILKPVMELLREDAPVDQALELLNRLRRQATAEQLYASNQPLTMLIHWQVLHQRQRQKAIQDAVDTSTHWQRLRHLEEQISQRTQHSAMLPNSERLCSRTRKLLQWTDMFLHDRDVVAADVFLRQADVEFAHAAAWSSSEAPVACYRPKVYFRSQKRLLRSELYCFPQGRSQKAVITVANPLGVRLTGTLQLMLPDAWQAEQALLPYDVEPLSRQILELSLTAPKATLPGKKYVLTVRDMEQRLDDIHVELEVVSNVPPAPILGSEVSTGEFTGN